MLSAWLTARHIKREVLIRNLPRFFSNLFQRSVKIRITHTLIDVLLLQKHVLKKLLIYGNWHDIPL